MPPGMRSFKRHRGERRYKKLYVISAEGKKTEPLYFAKFEYWLLLHFEDGNGIQSSAQCSAHLKRYFPSYDKGVNPKVFTKEKIEEAVSRAERRDNPPCEDWPRSTGSTVYRLVKSLIKNV